MKTDALKDNPAFFEKPFRQDVKRLCALSEQKIQKLKEFVQSFERHEDFTDKEKWLTFSAELGEALDDIVRYIRPLQFVAAVSVESKCSIEDLLSDLSEVGLIPTEKQHVLLSLCEHLQKLVAIAAAEIAPSLPLLRIRSISTRSLLVSEFDEEFSTKKHTVDTYKPNVSRLHPITTLKLTFRDDEHKPIGIHLSPDDLDTLIKWLELARVQMRTLAEFCKQRDLPSTSEDTK